jgi:hypothetical protein
MPIWAGVGVLDVDMCGGVVGVGGCDELCGRAGAAIMRELLFSRRRLGASLTLGWVWH